LSPVEGEKYVYQLLAPSIAQMPAEMIAVVKLFNAKYGNAMQQKHCLSWSSGPITLWMLKGCRHTPTKTKSLIGIAISKPQIPPHVHLPTPKSTDQGDEATYSCGNALNPPEHDTLPKVATPGPQSAKAQGKKLLSVFAKMSTLLQTLQEEAEIVVETPAEGNKHLDLNTADILLLDGDEFIAAKMGGIGLIANVYEKVGFGMASDPYRKLEEDQQVGAKEKEPSTLV